MRKFFYKVLLAVNILFASALLFSYLAVHINPQNFALPAFFGLAYPYLLLINIILAVTWAVLLRYEAFISVVVIAIGFTHLSNYIKIGKPSGNKEGTFKVMSYNLRLFNYFESPNSNSEKKVLAFLKSQNPDILFLQEIYMNGDPGQKDLAFKSALGGKYYSHMKVISSGKNHYYGIATYSKYPIIRKGAVIHPGSSSLSIFSDIIIQKDTFRIFNNHLQSFRLKRMERSFLDEMTASDDKEALGEMKNLSVSLKKGFVRRALQATYVKAQITQSPYPVIVAGDFNDTPVSYSYRKIRKGLNDSFVNSGYGAGFTYKGNYPANRIDYILYDNSLVSTWFEILKVKYSDHYPVAAYFKKRN
ncbi:MAG: endonuclease/exonuclease/phosphatase family protein [Bacteroidales bacterium]|nr:endonuclease/exonuclease/phosphatase family protein [Bacteroidales bacterium]